MLIFERQQNSTNHPIGIYLALSDGITPATGKTPAIKINKDGQTGTATTASGAITEVDSTNQPGWYSWAGNATDRNTLGDALCMMTATGCAPSPFRMPIKAYDPWNVLPSANAGGASGLPVNNSAGNVPAQVNAIASAVLNAIAKLVYPYASNTYFLSNDGGSDANDGLSVGTAWGTLNNALAACTVPCLIHSEGTQSAYYVDSGGTVISGSIVSNVIDVTLTSTAPPAAGDTFQFLTGPLAGQTYTVSGSATDGSGGYNVTITGLLNGTANAGDTWVSYSQITDTAYIANLANDASSAASNGTTLLSRVTAARAGFWDNLNVGGAVASHADFVALGSPMQAGTAVVLASNGLDGVSTASPYGTDFDSYNFRQQLLWGVRRQAHAVYDSNGGTIKVYDAAGNLLTTQTASLVGGVQTVSDPG